MIVIYAAYLLLDIVIADMIYINGSYIKIKWGLDTHKLHLLM